MELIKTFTETKRNQYSEYLTLLQVKKWTFIQVPSIIIKNRDDFDGRITLDLTRQRDEYEEGIYKIQCSYDLLRYVYVHIVNNEVEDIYFDREQLQHVEELLEIEHKKVSILQEQAQAFVDGNKSKQQCIEEANGRMLVGILAVFANWESDVISERTIDGMLAMCVKGKYPFSKTPFGWDKDEDKYLSINVK